jgi:hypothetical protein
MQKKLYLLGALMLGISLPLAAMWEQKMQQLADLNGAQQYVEVDRSLDKALTNAAESHQKSKKSNAGDNNSRRRRESDDDDDAPRRRGFGFRRRGPWGYGYGEDAYRDPSGKGVLNEHFMDIMFGPNGTVKGYLRPGASSKDYFNAMGEIVKYSALRGITGGVIDATDAVVKEKFQSFLGASIGAVENAFSWAWHSIMHGRACSVSKVDIARWLGSTKNLFKHLISAAEDFKANSRIGADMGRYHLPTLGGDTDKADVKNGDKEKQKQPVVDILWKESSRLYLIAIENIVAEINLRKSYYKSTDEIVHCFDSILLALVGEISIQEFKQEDGTKRVEYSYGGGVYRCIKEAASLNDLSSVEKVSFLKSIHTHIKGRLKELLMWVKVKNSKKNKKKLSLDK